MKPNLDSLPLELRQRIVSLGSFEAWHSISLVNRTLYQTCNDINVVKALVDNRNGHGGQAWNYPHLAGQPLSVWRHYALADSKTNGLCIRDVLLRPDASTLLWAPQLLATKHPISLTVDADMIKTTFGIAPILKRQEGIAHSFCMVIACMHPDLGADSTSPDLHQVFSVLRGNFWNLRCNYPQYRDGSARISSGSETEDTHQRNELVKNALRSLAILILHLRTQLNGEGLMQRWRQTHHPSRPLSLPSPWTIPFHEHMDLPAPFAHLTTKTFGASHLPRMTEESFLECGEWCGYYSLPSGGFNLYETFDPPMYGIKLSITAKHHRGELLEIKGTGGEDAVGPFMLDGNINVENGLLHLQKKYANYGPTWIWKGYLSPFGIVAAWGKQGWGGLVWLYKTSWIDHESDQGAERVIDS